MMSTVMRMRDSHPERYHQLVSLGKRHFARWLGVYPRRKGGEIAAVRRVLKSSQWNMTYGVRLEHERLEADFAAFVGLPHAVAVGTGGMGLQMALRALGVKPGDEVLHQVDTCSASAMSVMNVGATPVFTDIDKRTNMIDLQSLQDWSGPRSKAVLATHSWGNPENLSALAPLAQARGLRLVEDGCQALGARSGGRSVGHWGDAVVFSFGCLKPVQAGEGGIILTRDEALARELRAMRHYGERSFDFNERDTLMPAWNGRMSEFVAAVARAQLKHYPGHLANLRENACWFAEQVRDLPGLTLLWGAGDGPADSAITQVVARLDPGQAKLGKQALWDGLLERGVPVWHGNFELIPALGVFRNDAWRPWLPMADATRMARNYLSASHPNALELYERTGLGFSRINFMTRRHTRNLVKSLRELLG